MQFYQVDDATLQTINALLEADILQLLLIAPIMVVIGQMITSILAFWRERQRQRTEDIRRQQRERQESQQAEADDKIINRLIDIAERQSRNAEIANANTAALTTAINNLDHNQQESEKERRAVHELNREGIQSLVEGMNTLNKGMTHWSTLIDDTVAGLRSELVKLMNDVGKIQETESEILSRLADPDLRKRIEKVIGDSNRQIISRLDELLARIPKNDPPPTPPGAKQDAPTVDLPVDAVSDQQLEDDDDGADDAEEKAA